MSPCLGSREVTTQILRVSSTDEVYYSKYYPIARANACQVIVVNLLMTSVRPLIHLYMLNIFFIISFIGSQLSQCVNTTILDRHNVSTQSDITVLLKWR